MHDVEVAAPRIHRPPPDDVIRSLTSAGLSPSTVRAMEWWKAREVLELLRPDLGNPGPGGPGARPVLHPA